MRQPLFQLPIMGRELPRAQRFVDVPGEDEGRDDPGFALASYLAWERGEVDDLDWQDADDYEELVAAVLPQGWLDVSEADDDWEPEPEILVWVNGLPLEEWLAISDAGPTPHVDAMWARLEARYRGQYVPEDQLVEGDRHADRRDRRAARQRDRRLRPGQAVSVLVDSIPRSCHVWCAADCRGHKDWGIYSLRFAADSRKRGTHSTLRPHERMRLDVKALGRTVTLVDPDGREVM